MPAYYYSYFLLLAVGILTGMLRWKVLTPSLRIFWGLLVGTFLIEVAGRWILLYCESNVAIYSIFRFVSFPLIVWAYFIEIQNKNLLLLILGFWIVHALNLAYLQKFALVYDSYSIIFPPKITYSISR